MRQRRGIGGPIARVLAAALAAGAALPASAQLPMFFAQVYPDDSVVARESLVRAKELADGGSEGEAVRVLQGLLEREGERVLEVPGSPELFVPVRRHVHDLLLSIPALLRRYRSSEEARAQAFLDDGQAENVERSRLLTRAGLTAALRVAQRELESGRLESAWQTLSQLEKHPDRAADRDAARDAANLMTLLSRYLSRGEVEESAQRWAREASDLGARVEPRGSAYDAMAMGGAFGPLEPGEAMDLDSVPTHPLQSVGFSRTREDDEEDAAGPAVAGVPPPAVFPTVLGDIVYVNDGTQVAAYDRQTLSPIWRVVPARASSIPTPGDEDFFGRIANRSGLDDVLCTAVSGSAHGGVVVAVTGRGLSGRRLGDARAHGLDAATGAVLWSVEPASLDRALAGGAFRGPGVIDGDTVVLAVRKPGTFTRVAGLYLVGLDLYSGQARWVRLAASIGRLPWGPPQRRADASIVHQGIVYRADDLGIVLAYEASTGRPVWVRRLAPTRMNDRMIGRGEISAAYMAHTPIIDGASLIVQDPGDLSVLRLDLTSGTLLGRRDAQELDSPRYLVRVGAYLAAVGHTRVAFVKLAELEKGTVRLSPVLGEAKTGSPAAKTMAGRAVAAGDRLLVPIPSGLAEINPQEPDAARLVATEASGNMVSTGGQLLAAGATSVSTFITWERARASMLKRITDRPDAVPLMLTYVDLAYRAGHASESPAMAERALDILDASQRVGVTQNERRRLFELLTSILRGGEGPGDEGVSDRLLRCYERSAESASERAAYLLHVGSARESQRKLALAVEAYQELLADADAAGARLTSEGNVEVSGGSPAQVNAGELARARLAEVVRREGYACYAAFDEEAERAAGELGADAKAEKLLGVARRYPLARCAPALAQRAAAMMTKEGRLAEATRALAEGLRGAEAMVAGGAAGQMPAAESTAAALLTLLKDQRRFAQAFRVARRLGAAYPEMGRGGALELASWAREMRSAAAGGHGRAKIGAGVAIDGERTAQVLEGWQLAEPLIASAAGSPTDCVLMESSAEGRVALFVEDAASGRLAQAWSRKFDRHPPSALAVELEHTYLYWPDADGGSVEAVDNITGVTRWKTGSFAKLFGPDAQPRRAASERFATPASGEVRSGDLVVSMDAGTLLLVERGGRAAGVSIADGALLWAAKIELSRVYDVAGVEGVLVVAGSGDDDAAPDAPVGACLLSLDKRTGARIARLASGHAGAEFGDHVRWLRATPEGSVVVGLMDGLMLYEPRTGKPVWTNRATAIKNSAMGVVGGGRVLVVDGESELWSCPLAARDEPKKLDTGRNRVDYPIRMTPTDGAMLVSSAHGLLVVSATGDLIGADAMDGEESLLTPAVGESVAVAVQTASDDAVPTPADLAKRAPASIYFFATDSARLLARESIVLHDEAQALALIDDKIVITAGAMSIVLDAPAK